jgi:hypothetical protein
MSRKVKSIRREGAYIVKSAESPPSRVPSKRAAAAASTPTADDKLLVETLRRTKARLAS